MIWVILLVVCLVLFGLLVYYVLEKQYINGSNSVESKIREGIIENIKPGVIMYRLDKPENTFVEAKYRYIKILDIREGWVKFCHESLFQDDEKMTFNEDFPCYYEIGTLIDLYKIYYGKEQQ
jgi:hypothetical protein